MAFIDFRKAFDSVSHTKLWRVLSAMGVHPNSVKLLTNLYNNQQASVRIEKELTEWFRVGKGVRQGCLVSPVLFNFYSEEIMRESADELGWIGVTISGRTINNLRFADDIVLIATSPQELQMLLDKVQAKAEEFQLELNSKKTKVMSI